MMQFVELSDITVCRFQIIDDGCNVGTVSGTALWIHYNPFISRGGEYVPFHRD